jgi:hypothetical protein
MLNAKSHPYIQLDHLETLNILLRGHARLEATVAGLYRYALSVLREMPETENLNYAVRQVKTQTSTSVQVVNNKGYFVTLTKQHDKPELKLDVGRFFLATFENANLQTQGVEFWPINEQP